MRTRQDSPTTLVVFRLLGRRLPLAVLLATRSSHIAAVFESSRTQSSLRAPAAQYDCAPGRIRTSNVCFEGRYDIRFTTGASQFTASVYN